MTAQDWIAKDKQHLWHPFTQMRDWLDEDPLIIERAEGFELIDTQGQRYIDGHSSLWVNIHGHGHPTIVDAIAQQAQRLDHSTMLGLGNTPSIEFAERLVNCTPSNLTRVFYSDAGSTAMEIALKMSFQYWKLTGQKRDKFITFDGAYHGDTIGSVSVGGMELFHEIFQPLLFHTLRAPYPDPQRSDTHRDDLEGATEHCLAAVEKLLQDNAGSVAAIVTEPGVQGASGMYMTAPGFLTRLRALADQYDVHLIVDEVATGFGRTGTLFACEVEGVQPDFMSLAKGITGGVLPLAATLTTEKVFEAFLGRYEEYKSFFHGHSYTGNPIACAAALANLDLFEQGLIETMQQPMEQFGAAVAELEADAHILEVRRRGWMTGIEIVQDEASRAIFDPALKVPQRIVEVARSKGAVIRPLGNVMVLMPAPAMDAETALRLVAITRESIAEVVRNV